MGQLGGEWGENEFLAPLQWTYTEWPLRESVYSAVLSDFRFPASKSRNSKWKPLQQGHRTSPDFKSTWFSIIEKILEFDEKILSSQPKTASQGAL